MSDPGTAKARVRIHPVDVLVLVLAVGLGAIAYAYLFQRSPVARPIDPLLGAEIELEFSADRDWKKGFPAKGTLVDIEDSVVADVLDSSTVAGDPPRTRFRVRVRERAEQRPDTMTLFRTGIRRGTRLRISNRDSEVQAEVLSVRIVPEAR